MRTVLLAEMPHVFPEVSQPGPSNQPDNGELCEERAGNVAKAGPRTKVLHSQVANEEKHCCVDSFRAEDEARSRFGGCSRCCRRVDTGGALHVGK